MSDKLLAAVGVLEEQLEDLQKETQETKRMINSLLRKVGKPPRYTDAEEKYSNARPDQYYGKPLATAAREYLAARNQACSSKEILEGLMDGGFDFRATEWKANDRLRMLAISLAKNTAMFHRLPNGTFGLLSWYDTTTLRKAERSVSVKEIASSTADSTAQHEEDAEVEV
jgi:hypothetical protein